MENYESKNSHTKEISPGIWLHKESVAISEKDSNEMIIWKIEITTMSIVEFEVDLSNSQNIKLENSNELKNSVVIKPFETKEIARILIYGKPVIKAKFKLSLNVPDKSFQESIIKNDLLKIQQLEHQCRINLNDNNFELINQSEIEQILSEKNIEKFVDFEFPPIDSSFIGLNNDQIIKEDLDYIFHWRRPENFVLLKPDDKLNSVRYNNAVSFGQKIMSEIPKINIFNNNEPQPNDIHQEMLPENNLASALSGIAEKFNLVSRLFKSKVYENVGKFGIYQILLFINGAAKTVVIDDLFPCIPMGNPIVTRSPSNEIWVLLIEKAIAKVMEGYYNIINLTLAESLIILTGCPTFSLNIEDLTNNCDDETFANKLINYAVNHNYLVMAINNQEQQDEDDENNNNMNNNLILSNHGYTVLNVLEYKGKYFVNLRKIWFDSDIEKNAIDYQKKISDIYPNLIGNNSEGTMLMLLEDFKKEFNSIVVCYTKSWNEIRIRGDFVYMKENEKAKYEQYISEYFYCFSIDTPSKVIISLFQDEDKYRNNESRKQIMDISLSILTYNTSSKEISHYQTVDFSHSSNIQTELDLNKGMYIILPRTSGCFIGKPIDGGSNNNNNPNASVSLYDYSLKKMSNLFSNIIKDIFNKFDKSINNKLNYQEFKNFYFECTKKNISVDEFNNKILPLYPSYDGGITERGFIQFFEQNYLQYGDTIIRNWMNNLGYDNDLYCYKSRNFILTFHSNKNLSINQKINFNSNINSKVNKILLKNFGEAKEDKQIGEIVPVYYQSKLNNVVTFGCQNKSNKDLNVKLMFINNGDILFNSNNQMEKIVKAKDMEFFFQFYIISPEKIDDLNYTIETSNI